MVPLLLESLRTGDFADAHFLSLDALNAKLLSHHDLLVHGSYLSFLDAELWARWYQFWNLSTRVGERPLVRAATRALQAGDFADFEHCDHKGAMAAYDEHLQSACRAMEAAEAGTLSMTAAVEMLDALSRSCWSHYREADQQEQTTGESQQFTGSA